jgi:hypothetical protein
MHTSIYSVTTTSGWGVKVPKNLFFQCLQHLCKQNYSMKLTYKNGEINIT